MLLSSLLVIGLTLVGAADIATQTDSVNSKVSIRLQEELRENDGSSRQGILVRFPRIPQEDLTAEVFSQVFEENFASADVSASLPPNLRQMRRAATQNVLRSHARLYQAPLIETLHSLNVEHESLWVGNSIFIRKANKHLIDLISQDTNVIAIDANENVAELMRPVHDVEDVVDAEPTKDADQVNWNLALINADKAWNITKGEGVTVATIDSGVFYTHSDLIKNYRGYEAKEKAVKSDFNWYDPSGSTKAPNDNNGHGTHTMGSIAGSSVGVAPGVKWIAARGCNYYCSEYDLTSSGQWVICPKSLDKSEEDCSLGADIVSNSWGGSRGSDWYEEIATAWQVSGVIPVFAQGNSGPSCSTANSPGDLFNVLGVASVDQYSRLSSFSSRGPGIGTEKFPLLKPDISAPGDRVKSTWIDGSFKLLSGTSMACPHIAGVIALMLSANPNLEYEVIYDILRRTANTELKAPTGRTACDGVEATDFPNYHYGHGLVDAYAAVKEAQKEVGFGFDFTI